MSSTDRIKAGLLSIISHVLQPTDYHAMYPARVVLQTEGGLLEVVPDDPRLVGITNVPIRYGIPCVTAKIRPGSRVLIQFENGNPKCPVATVWDSASVEHVIIAPDKTYLGGNSDDAWPIARVGDMVECYLTVAEVLAAVAPGATPPAVLKLPGMIQTGATKGFSA